MLSRYDLDEVKARLAAYESARTTRGVEDPASSTPPNAAVAIVLRASPLRHEAEMLFIRRSEREGDPWSGHIAFPGGRSATKDSSLVATAIRETHEEVGLLLDQDAALLATMPPQPARGRGIRLPMTIAPFVFALSTPDAPLILAQSEVAETLWTPLGELARREYPGTHSFEYAGERYELPCLYLGPHTLWGLTYMMLMTFLGIIDPDAQT